MATQKRVPRVFVRKFPWKMESGYSPGLDIDYDSNEVDITYKTIPGGAWFEKNGNSWRFRGRNPGNYNTDLTFTPKAGFEDKYEPVTLTFKTEVYNKFGMGQLNWNMINGWKSDLTLQDPTFQIGGGNAGLIRMEVVQAIENGVASGQRVTAKGNGAFVVYGFAENGGSMAVTHGWTVNTSGFTDEPTYPRPARPVVELPYQNIKLPINSSHKVDLQFFPPNSNYEVLIPRKDVTTFDMATKTLTLSGVVTEGTNKPNAAIGVKANINGYFGDEFIFNVVTTRGPAMSVYPMFVGNEVNSSETLDIQLFNGATLEFENKNPDLFDFDPATSVVHLKAVGDGILELYPTSNGVRGDKQVVRIGIHPKPKITILDVGPYEITRGTRIPLDITVTPEDSYIVASSNNPGLWFDAATNEIVTGGNNADYDGVLTFTANRQGINSDPVIVNVRVNMPPKPWIEVVPAGPLEVVPNAPKKNLRVKCSHGASWDYVSSDRNLAVMDYNSGAITVADRPGSTATLTFKAYKDGVQSDPLLYEIKIVAQETPPTPPTITIEPAGPIEVRKNTRTTFTPHVSPGATWTCSSSNPDNITVDENTNEIVVGNVPGESAIITFIAHKDGLDSDPASLVVNVKEDPKPPVDPNPPVVDPSPDHNPPVNTNDGYDNWDNVKTLLADTAKNGDEKIQVLRASLSQAGSIVQVFYSYKKRIEPNSVIPPKLKCVGLIYNMLFHMKYILSLEDEKEFLGSMDILSLMLKEYETSGLHANDLMRYTTAPYEESWKSVSGETYTKHIRSWSNIVKIITSLKDPATRPTELAKLNLDELLNSETTIFNSKCLENAKKYYTVTP